MPGENQAKSNNSSNGQERNSQRKLSPELVRRVAERVYVMLRDELLIERERARASSAIRTGGFRG